MHNLRKRHDAAFKVKSGPGSGKRGKDHRPVIQRIWGTCQSDPTMEKTAS